VPTTESRLQLEISQECIEIESNPRENSEGILVFQKEYGAHLTFVDTQTGNHKIVPDDPNMQVRRAYISPDGKWLIYQVDWGEESGETKFILTNADGIQQKEMPFNGDWISSDIFWLNNTSLRVAEWNIPVEAINIFSFDPFTETKTALQSDFPNMASKGINWGIDRPALEMGLFKGTNIIYDPTLARVLYPKNNNSVSLFNLETNQEITELSIPGRSRLPKWSPDGKSVAILGKVSNSSKGLTHDEFYIVSRDGSNLERLSYALSVGKQVHIENYSWSPDGNRIALWLKPDTNASITAQNPFELAVLDLKTNAITNYCISGTSTIDYETYTDLVNIIWSPDGTQLLIVRYNDDNNKNTDEVIVDLTNTTAYNVAENMQPIGWMSTEP
jgi:hypothetical protein